MQFRRIRELVAVLALAGALPRCTFAAAQKAVGVATSAKPTAPTGSSLYKLQIQFDPGIATAVTSDIPRGVSGFQLTVGWNSLILSLDSTLPIYNSPFTAADVAISQPFTQANVTSFTSAAQGPSDNIDTYVTVSGHTSQPVVGDVNIFSLVFQGVSPLGQVNAPPMVGIMGSDHSRDLLPPNQSTISPDSVTLTDPHNLADNLVVGPSGIETTVITASFDNLSFTTQQGNSGLAAVPLPVGVWAALAGLVIGGTFHSRVRRALA